jgi:hypothetical protein
METITKQELVKSITDGELAHAVARSRVLLSKYRFVI